MRLHRNSTIVLSLTLVVMAYLIVNVQNTSKIGYWYYDDLQKIPDNYVYTPAPIEQFIMDHSVEWGWDDEEPNPQGCLIWNDADFTSIEMYSKLQSYINELEEYYDRIMSFPPQTEDLRKTMLKSGNKKVCNTLRLHPDGLSTIFRESGPTLLSHSSHAGYMEPLITPMRHPKYCFEENGGKSSYLMNMEYMIHDFETMCNRKIHPHSRTIFIDAGASLNFHKDDRASHSEVLPPIVTLLELYEKFGIHFDHIYGYELKFTDPNQVYGELLPRKYMTSYHWINAGVTSELDHDLNPWDSLLRQFTPDDFVVVKLDIDTSSIEVPLAYQLLNDINLRSLVDQFYFEHHVHMKEMSRSWGDSMSGSLCDTFDLFHHFRQNGVASHFWV